MQQLGLCSIADLPACLLRVSLNLGRLADLGRFYHQVVKLTFISKVLQLKFPVALPALNSALSYMNLTRLLVLITQAVYTLGKALCKRCSKSADLT